MVRVGIIGTGRMGRIRAESIQKHTDDAIVAAVADPFMDDETRKWATGLGIRDTYVDYRKIIENPGIDAVCVCTPTDLHYEVSMAALKMGKHVFCEKPIDYKLESAKRLCDETKKMSVKYQVGFNRRSDHNYKALRALVEEGALGKIYLLHIPARDEKIPPYSYVEHSGGMFFDFQIHDFDMVRYLMGCDVTEVFAWGDTLIDPKLKKYDDIDTAVISLRMETGALAVIDASRHSPAKAIDRRAEITGTRGQAIITNDRLSNVEVTSMEGTIGQRPIENFLLRFKDSYHVEIGAFIKAIIEGTEVPVSAEDGYKAMQIAVAATKSLKEGRPVKISELTE